MAYESLAINDELCIDIFPTNKSIITYGFHVNKSTIINDLPAKKRNISPDFYVNGDLITMVNANITNNSGCLLNTGFQIEQYDNTTSLISVICLSKKLTSDKYM